MAPGSVLTGKAFHIEEGVCDRGKKYEYSPGNSLVILSVDVSPWI